MMYGTAVMRVDHPAFSDDKPATLRGEAARDLVREIRRKLDRGMDRWARIEAKVRELRAPRAGRRRHSRPETLGGPRQVEP